MTVHYGDRSIHLPSTAEQARQCLVGAHDQWQMLDAAEARLAELEPSLARVIPLREPKPVDEQVAAPATAIAAPAAAAAARPSLPAPVAITSTDPEFLQLFVEEARENASRLAVLYPQWEQNPQDAAALRDLRRAFHTLKGSGRMVGAQ